MKKFLNYLLSLVGFGLEVEVSQLVPVVIEESLPTTIHVRQLTCVPSGAKGKKVRFVTRRGHQMVAEIVDRNGGGEVFLRRPGHRFGPTFRRVLTE